MRKIFALILLLAMLFASAGLGLIVFIAHAHAATCPYKDAYNHCVRVPSKPECEAGLVNYHGNKTVNFYLKYSIACVEAYPRMFEK